MFADMFIHAAKKTSLANTKRITSLGEVMVVYVLSIGLSKSSTLVLEICANAKNYHFFFTFYISHVPVKIIHGMLTLRLNIMLATLAGTNMSSLTQP